MIVAQFLPLEYLSFNRRDNRGTNDRIGDSTMTTTTVIANVVGTCGNRRSRARIVRVSLSLSLSLACPLSLSLFVLASPSSCGVRRAIYLAENHKTRIIVGAPPSALRPGRRQIGRESLSRREIVKIARANFGWRRPPVVVWLTTRRHAAAGAIFSEAEPGSD